MTHLKRLLHYVIIIMFLVATQNNILNNNVNAFTLSTVHNRQKTTVDRKGIKLNISNTNDDVAIDLSKSFKMSDDETAPLVCFNKGSGKEKCINSFGMLHVLATITTLPIWWLSMSVTDAICNAFPDLDPNRAFYDKTGKIWSKIYLSMTDSFPTQSGEIQQLKDDSDPKPCLYVANHASWLDIPVLCTVLSPVFKFIAKGELLGVPCIGKQLRGVSFVIIVLLSSN